MKKRGHDRMARKKSIIRRLDKLVNAPTNETGLHDVLVTAYKMNLVHFWLRTTK